MKKGRLIIMRHGLTQYNVDQLMTGHTDIPLLPEGVEQGKRAGHILKKFNINAAYSSPLQRAFNTLSLALDTANSHNNLRKADGSWDVKLRDALKEKCVGDYAGLNHRKDKRITSTPWKYDRGFPNGESDKQVVERVRKFYEEELKPRLEKGETIAISCHAGVKRAFMVVMGEIETEKLLSYTIPNAQPWVVEFENGVKKQSYLFDPKSPDSPPTKFKPQLKRHLHKR